MEQSSPFRRIRGRETEECVNKARQGKRRHLLHFQNPMPPPPPPRISFHWQLPLVGNLSLASGAIDGSIFSIVLLPRSFGFINPRLSLLYSAMPPPLFCPRLFLFPPPRLIPPQSTPSCRPTLRTFVSPYALPFSLVFFLIPFSCLTHFSPSSLPLRPVITNSCLCQAGGVGGEIRAVAACLSNNAL